MKKTLWFTALCAATLLAACTNLKEPATQAVATAESSLSTIREAAAQYAPEGLQAVDAQIESLKKDLAAGNFKGVIAAAPSVTSAIGTLTATVNEKKAAMAAAIETAKQSWASFGTEMPQMIAALQSRVDMLSKSKHLPANVDKPTFESAKSGLETLKSGWTEASNAFTSGDAVGAVAKAESLKTQGAEILAKLGMTGG